MNSKNALSNQLLIAMPGMADPNFSTTVTLVCEHNAEGALGIIINRPLELNFGGLLQQLEHEDVDETVTNQSVLNGGPVAPERGFVLHNPGGKFDSSIDVSTDIQLTLSRDVIDAMATGQGPDQSLVAIGYAGWDAGQLENEMLSNVWLTVPASPEVVFDIPFADRWAVAANTIGIDISRMSADVGHA